MATRPRLTAEDLRRISEGDARYELVNGDILELPRVNALHARVMIRVGRLLDEWVDAHGGGVVFGGDLSVVLHLPYDAERLRLVDIAYFCSERLPLEKIPEKWLPGAPDLAVEILSPSDRSADTQQKVRDYLEAGARMVWIIAPEVKTVTVYRADGSARLVKEHEQLDGDDVLPGLAIPLAKVFP
jgi:Uma2 family endonuclease